MVQCVETTVLALGEHMCLRGSLLLPKIVQCQECRSVLQQARSVLHMCDPWCDAASYMILAECIPKEDRPDKGAWPTGLGGFLDQCMLSP